MALFDPARNEPRDLYDLWFITQDRAVKLDFLAEFIRQKSKYIFGPIQNPNVLGSILMKLTILTALHPYSVVVGYVNELMFSEKDCW